MNCLSFGRLAAAGLLFGLAACGSDNSTVDIGGESTVSGVAAVGAPITGASVNLNCGGGTSRSAVTGSDGRWTITLPSGALPCSLLLSGGSIGGTANGDSFFSFVQGGGSAITINVTPLTALAVARAVQTATGQSLQTWSARPDLAGTLSQVAAAMSSAQTALLAALQTGGFSLPAGTFDVFGTPFTPVAGNPYDDLLEAYSQALAAAGSNYAAALAAFSAGGALPSVPTPPTEGDSVAYDGHTYRSADTNLDYRTDLCEGSISLTAFNLDNGGGFLLVRVGASQLANGSQDYDVAALNPGVGTPGPIAAGKVQLYLYFGSDNQTWTGDGAQGKVRIVFDGEVATAVASDILLRNGKRIGFDLRAAYVAPEACEQGSEAQQVVEQVKQLSGSYSLRANGGSCALPLGLTSSAFTGSLLIGEDGSLRIGNDADAGKSLAISPSDNGFGVVDPPNLHYQLGELEIRLLENPGSRNGVKVIEAKAANGCDAYLKVSSEAPATGDSGSGTPAALGDAEGASFTALGSARLYTASVLSFGQNQDGTLEFNTRLKTADGGSDFNNRLRIGNLPAVVGKHGCGLLRVQAVLGDSGVYTSGGNCVVEVMSVNYQSGQVEGRFAGRLEKSASEFIDITDGYFRKN